MRKIIISLLMISMVFILVSCGGGNQSGSGTEDKPPVNNDNSTVPNYSGGNMSYSNIDHVEGSIHQFNATETNDYVVENGQTNYKILIPANASVNLLTYVSEFVSLFKEATNIELEVVTDAQEYDSNKQHNATIIKGDYE